MGVGSTAIDTLFILMNEKTQGPSSYMPAEMQPLDLNDCTNSIKQAYKEW